MHRVPCSLPNPNPAKARRRTGRPQYKSQSQPMRVLGCVFAFSSGSLVSMFGDWDSRVFRGTADSGGVLIVCCHVDEVCSPAHTWLFMATDSGCRVLAACVIPVTLADMA